MSAFVWFQGRANGGGGVSVIASEVQAVSERHVVGGVYCELHLRGGGRIDVWGRSSEVERKCEENSYCRGCRRYVVVGLRQGEHDVPPEVALPLMREMNDGYAAPWGRG